MKWLVFPILHLDFIDQISMYLSFSLSKWMHSLDFFRSSSSCSIQLPTFVELRMRTQIDRFLLNYFAYNLVLIYLYHRDVRCKSNPFCILFSIKKNHITHSIVHRFSLCTAASGSWQSVERARVTSSSFHFTFSSDLFSWAGFCHTHMKWLLE